MTLALTNLSLILDPHMQKGTWLDGLCRPPAPSATVNGQTMTLAFTNFSVIPNHNMQVGTWLDG